MRITELIVVSLMWAPVWGGAAEPPYWPCQPNDGMPFGQLTDANSEEFVRFASKNGLDLDSTLRKVYAGDKEALATIFRFSERLKVLDLPARVYGQMVYSIFLNLGESKGPDFVISAVSAQEAGIRQRLRDFLWYPVFCLPASKRADAGKSSRTEFPELWPPDYKFGDGDDLFANPPNNALQPAHSAVTPRAGHASRQPAGG